jgi:hypothetical protein
LLAAHDVDCCEFAALYMLQYGLPRHAKRAHRFAHRQEAIAGLTVEAGLEVFGEANTPGGAGCQLLAWDDAVIEQAMDGRWRNAERGRGLLNRQQLALWRAGRRLEAGNTPVAAQIADAAGDEAMTICRATPLPIENAGDYAVGVMDREPAHQCDRVLISADGGRPRARQGEIDLAERAALPAQREMGRGLVALDLDDDFFEERAQQLLAVARRGRGRLPDGGEIGPEREEAVALCLRDHPRPLPFAALEIGLGGFELPQALFPIAFEAARHQPVVGVDGAIAALGTLRFVTCPLHPEPPLLQGGPAIAFEPLGGGESGGKPGRLQGADEGPGDGLVDLDAADIEAIDAAALDKNLARAMITR